MSDPSISDIDFKIKMFGSELSIISNIFKFLIFKTLDLSPEEQKKKNEEKYSAIRKVITLMIHCIDCDDEECALMPYCLDYQDLLVHMEECTEKKCRMKVT